MAYLNENYLKLQAGYLFPEIARRVKEFCDRNPDAAQLSTEDFYSGFPLRAVAADVHGIPIRVASLEDTLRGKIKAWSDAEKRRSKQIKDLADIARLVEAHPRLWDELSDELKNELHLPGKE